LGRRHTSLQNDASFLVPIVLRLKLIYPKRSGGHVKSSSGASWTRHAAPLFALLLVVAPVTFPQTTPNATLVVIVTKDGALLQGARVVISPRGVADDWPVDKTQIELTTDAKGRCATPLGPGKYQVKATEVYPDRLPVRIRVAITPAQTKPIKIRLNLLEWDCAKVKCLL
jgi:hypothetical protein